MRPRVGIAQQRIGEFHIGRRGRPIHLVGTCRRLVRLLGVVPKRLHSFRLLVEFFAGRNKIGHCARRSASVSRILSERARGGSEPADVRVGDRRGIGSAWNRDGLGTRIRVSRIAPAEHDGASRDGDQQRRYASGNHCDTRLIGR